MMAQWAHPEGLLAKAGLGRACCPQRAATIQTAFNLCGVCGFYRRAGDSTPYLLAFLPFGQQAPDTSAEVRSSSTAAGFVRTQASDFPLIRCAWTLLRSRTTALQYNGIVLVVVVLRFTHGK